VRFSLLGAFLDEAAIGDEAYFPIPDKAITAAACKRNIKVLTTRIRAIEKGNPEVIELTKVKLASRGFGGFGN
jgi:hypothetical protein